MHAVAGESAGEETGSPASSASTASILRGLSRKPSLDVAQLQVVTTRGLPADQVEVGSHETQTPLCYQVEVGVTSGRHVKAWPIRVAVEGANGNCRHLAPRRFARCLCAVQDSVMLMEANDPTIALTAALWIPAVLALVGVVVGALLSPVATAWQARRTRINDEFDAALKSFRQVQAMRHFPQGISANYLDPNGSNVSAVEEFNRQERETAVREFYRATREARKSLAAVQGFDADIAATLDRSFELLETDDERLAEALARGRRRALRTRRSRR